MTTYYLDKTKDYSSINFYIDYPGFYWEYECLSREHLMWIQIFHHLTPVIQRDTDENDSLPINLLPPANSSK